MAFDTSYSSACKSLTIPLATHKCVAVYVAVYGLQQSKDRRPLSIGLLQCAIFFYQIHFKKCEQKHLLNGNMLPALHLSYVDTQAVDPGCIWHIGQTPVSTKILAPPTLIQQVGDAKISYQSVKLGFPDSTHLFAHVFSS
jgi:hypothetical protein